MTHPIQICIGSTIRIGQESWCLLYAGFFGFFCPPQELEVSHPQELEVSLRSSLYLLVILKETILL